MMLMSKTKRLTGVTICMSGVLKVFSTKEIKACHHANLTIFKKFFKNTRDW